MIDTPEPVKHIQRVARSGIGRGLFVIVSAAIISAVFAHHSVLHGIERWTFDTLAKIDPPAPRGVVVVDIDDASYETMFDGSSPLDPNVLARLIDAIAKGRPKVIGVDIDTSSRRFASFNIDPAWPPIIWARATRPVDSGGEHSTAVRRGDYALSVSLALGRSDPKIIARSAIPLVLADDSDRRVRRYQQVLTAAGSRTTAFPRLVAEQANQPLATADGRSRIIRYAQTEARLRIFAADAMTLGSSEGWSSTVGPLYGKVVLLGGSYAGLDRHATPLGEMKGVDILANVVETELAGSGATHPGWLRVFTIQIFGAVFLGLLLHLVQSRLLALAIFLTSVAVLAPLSSLLAYGALDRWLYFALVYLATAVHHVVDDVKKRMSIRQESAVIGAFDEIKSHWINIRNNRGPAQASATSTETLENRRGDAPLS